jgi:hypothetical protein
MHRKRYWENLTMTVVTGGSMAFRGMGAVTFRGVRTMAIMSTMTGWRAITMIHRNAILMKGRAISMRRSAMTIRWSAIAVRWRAIRMRERRAIPMRGLDAVPIAVGCRGSIGMRSWGTVSRQRGTVHVRSRVPITIRRRTSISVGRCPTVLRLVSMQITMARVCIWCGQVTLLVPTSHAV